MEVIIQPSHLGIQLTVILFLVPTRSSLGSEAPGMESKEYCQWETFEAGCGSDEVVVMERAINGRMGHGRCIESDFGWVGCQMDVLPLADARCSGRRSCKIGIPDRDFDKLTVSACPRDLTRYLVASYRCVKVVSPQRSECVGNTAVPVPLPRGRIASLSTVETNCGTTETPWLIDAKPGQHVNITLIDFDVATREAQNNKSFAVHSPPNACQVNCIVKEKRSGRTHTICGGDKRVSHVVESRDGPLELRVLPGSGEKTKHFLLQYDVRGCPHIEPPIGGRISMNGDVMTIICDISGNQWRLNCEGNKWMGTIPDCSLHQNSDLGKRFSPSTLMKRLHLLDMSTLRLTANSLSDANGVNVDPSFGDPRLEKTASLLTMVGIAALIGLCIFVAGLCCLKRCRSKPQRIPVVQEEYGPVKGELKGKDDPQAYEPALRGMTQREMMLDPFKSSLLGHHRLPQHRTRDGENEYESMDETQNDPGRGNEFEGMTCDPGLPDLYPYPNRACHYRPTCPSEMKAMQTFKNYLSPGVEHSMGGLVGVHQTQGQGRNTYCSEMH